MKITLYLPDDKKDVYTRAKELLEIEGSSISAFLLRKLEEYLKMQGWKGNPEMEKKVEGFVSDYLRLAWNDKSVEKRPKFTVDKKVIVPDFALYKDSKKHILDAFVDILLDASDEEAEMFFRSKLKDYFPIALDNQVNWYLLPILFAEGDQLKLRKLIAYDFKSLKKEEEYPNYLDDRYKRNKEKELEEFDF